MSIEAGELHIGDRFLWWGITYAVTGFVAEPDDPEQLFAGWIEAVYLQSPRAGDIGVFPPTERVQLLEPEHFPCQACEAPIDEDGGYCAECLDADEYDKLAHEWAHGPVRLR